jgi:hypothetical protein
LFGFTTGAFLATLFIIAGVIAIGYLVGIALWHKDSQARPSTQGMQEISAEDLRDLEAEAEGIKCEYCGSVMSSSGKM